MRRQAVLQIAVNDRRYGLTDAIDARQERAAGDETDHETCDGQDGDGGGQTVPEARLQRRKKRVVPAHQQVVAAQRGDVHQRRLQAVIAQFNLDLVVPGHRRHVGGPRRQIPGQWMQRAVRQQQDSLAGDLHAHAGVDEAPRALCAIALKDFGQPLRVDLQKFRAAVLDRHLPGIPQGRREQNQGNNPQCHIAERQRERG